MFPEGGEIDLDKLKAKRAIVATGKERNLPLKVFNSKLLYNIPKI